jgi:hypothetical protein
VAGLEISKMTEVEEIEFRDAWTKRFEDDPLGALKSIGDMLDPKDMLGLLNAASLAARVVSIYERLLPACARLVKYKGGFGANNPGSFFREWPYCFVRLQDGSWLPLNRQYKPIGYCQDEHYVYEKHANEAWQFTCDPLELDGVWPEKPGAPYLYREGDMNTVKDYEDYLRRLGRLIAATGDNGLVYMLRLLRTVPYFARVRRKVA